MPAAPRFTLKLSKLDWISLVDEPAQQTAKIRLIKRKGSTSEHEITMKARVAKIGGGDNPLVHCWAFTCTDETGQPYHDLQGDAISADDFVKAAEEFMAKGGGVDEMHDGKATQGRIAFAYPMDSTIAAAMLGKAAGDATKTSGLMVAIRPSAEQLVKIKSGEYTGVSIAGLGTRELVKRRRSAKPATRARKQAVLTDAVDGHQHTLDLDDPCDPWRDTLSTSYQTSEGATQSHSHAWTFSPDDGKVTIAEDSGHTHTVDAVVPDDVRAEAAANENGERCRSCNAMCDEDDRFCPSCGKPMGSDGVVAKPADDDDSGPTVIAISMRADVCDCGETMPASGAACPSCGKAAKRKSPPSGASRTVKGNSKEPTAMADDKELQALKAENALLKSMATLTDAQRAYHNKLVAKGLQSEATSFLALTSAQRNTALDEIAKSDPVVYVGKSNGKEYRQSMDIEIIEAAKALDSMAELQKRLETERSELDFAKRGDATLANFAKGAKENLRGRIMKALAKEFTDPAEYAEAERAMKAADFAIKESLSAPHGANPHLDPTAESQTVQAKLDALAANYAKTNNVPLRKAAAAVLETAEGAALYAQLPVGRA